MGWVIWFSEKMFLPAAQHEDPSSIPRLHVVEGENQILKLSSDLSYLLCIYTYKQINVITNF